MLFHTGMMNALIYMQNETRHRQIRSTKQFVTANDR